MDKCGRKGKGWLQIGQSMHACIDVNQYFCVHTTALTVWLKRCLHEYTNLFYRQTLFLQPGVMPGPGSVSPIMHISLSAPVPRPGQSECQGGQHWPTRERAEENSAMKISLSARGGAAAVSALSIIRGCYSNQNQKLYKFASRKWTRQTLVELHWILRLAFKDAVNAPIWGPPGTHRGDAALSGVLGLLSASLLEVSDKIMDTSIHRESSLAHPQTWLA